MDATEKDLSQRGGPQSATDGVQRIDRRIVKVSVVEDQRNDEPTAQAAAAPASPRTEMHERLARPERLSGETYKIKSPLYEHALYVTINDLVLNPGTEHEERRPFEVFINSKSMDHFQWIVALTRIISAVFRKGGDITFLAEELRAVFDPRGGYLKPGGLYVPSLVAEIGLVIERHLQSLGLLEVDQPSAEVRAWLDDKRVEFEANSGAGNDAVNGFPRGATLCPQCSTMAVVSLDGCDTCLNCGYSKCG